jgi:RHS repeat-associated protein
MEKDNESCGCDGNYTTHYRQLDTRIARWLSVDPITRPSFSPYNTMDDNPILIADPMGDCGPPCAALVIETGKAYAIKETAKYIIKETIRQGSKHGPAILRAAKNLGVSRASISIGKLHFNYAYSYNPIASTPTSPNVTTLPSTPEAVQQTETTESVISAPNPLVQQDLITNAFPMASEDVQGEAIMDINGNSKKSTKAQHGYEILDGATGNSVAKTGISGGKKTVDGKKSYRAQAQVNKWNKEAIKNGYKGLRYSARIVKDFVEGVGARLKALEWEGKNTKKHKGTLDEEKHKRPKF